MRNLLLCFLLFGSTLVAQNSNLKSVILICELTDCSDQIQLYRFNGIAFNQVAMAEKTEAGVYEFQTPAGGPSFYYVGARPDQLRPLVLGPDPEVTLRGSCKQMRATKAVSAFNEAYEKLRNEVNRLQQETGKLVQRYRFARQNPENMDEVLAAMAALDERKLALLDSLRQAGNDYFAAIVALNTYLSYQHHQGDYENEIDYYANEYFRNADLSKDIYEGMPWVYEAFKSYALTLASVGLPADQLKAVLDAALDQTPAASATRKLALGGIITSLRQKQNPNFADYGKRYIQEFGEEEPQAAAALQQELDRAQAFLPGGTPPDFSMETPAGEVLTLSDLRGKVVLIDFWASWCGPCRKENPNVVRLYNEYKDAGFDILGVSLDRKKDRWLQAIEQDGLAWRHVSDLQGWQNKAAKLYGVTSIPHTVLIDEKGRIIARNLRGQALEQKLAEIFD